MPGELGGGVEGVRELDALCIRFIPMRGTLDVFDPVTDEV